MAMASGVSTHSRLKAAGKSKTQYQPRNGFNTQPPEGGWERIVMADERIPVSTHSRLKAAEMSDGCLFVWSVFQHTAA
ncbi:hypothetical protein [Kingella denitrificans]